MSGMSLVSVIIPTHSGSENICRAVDSILAQTYENVEAIVVDDNGRGTEEQLKTQKEIEKYKDEPRVKYIMHEVNKNGSAARNTGIRASQGDYIAFLDDDDAFHPDNIEKHLALLTKLPEDYGLTYCGFINIIPGMKDEIIHPSQEGDVLFDFLVRKMRVGTSLILMKREVIDYVKEWDESFRRHQDWEFLARVLQRYKMGRVDNVGISKYITGRHNAKQPDVFMKNRIHFLEKMKPIIEQFEKKKQKKIYDVHYSHIGLEYFKAKKILKSIQWALKTSNPFGVFLGYFVSGLNYLKKRVKSVIK
ncbi:MAG: glycosyltransferase family 2 protein [Clostridia bacterium]|nr:glycosyltransferase family 2 protein [Clostridia bacterium]